MSDLEINFNLMCIVNTYDDFFTETPEQIQELFEAFYGPISIEKIIEFMENTSNEIKIKNRVL